VKESKFKQVKRYIVFWSDEIGFFKHFFLKFLFVLSSGELKKIASKKRNKPNEVIFFKHETVVIYSTISWRFHQQNLRALSVFFAINLNNCWIVSERQIKHGNSLYYAKTFKKKRLSINLCCNYGILKGLLFALPIKHKRWIH